MSSHLSFCIPGLLHFARQIPLIPSQDKPVLPALSRFLSKADRITETPQATLWAELYQLFLTSNHVQQEKIPWAYYSYNLDKKKKDAITSSSLGDKKYCYRADPVSMQIERDMIHVFSGNALQLSSQEATNLIQSINDFFQDVAWQLQKIGQHWYIHSDTALPSSNIPPSDTQVILHFSVEDKKWQTTLTELQMLLYADKVNQKRLQSGKLAINSIWLWGESVSTCQLEKVWDKVFSNDTLLPGLAWNAGTDCSACPDNFEQAIEAGLSDKKVLFYLPVLLEAIKNNDIYQWLNLLQDLEKNWFMPALQYLQQQQSKMELCTLNGQKYIMSKQHGYYFWRFSKRWDNFIESG